MRTLKIKDTDKEKRERSKMATLKEKIRNAGMGVGLAGLLAMTGCETPPQGELIVPYRGNYNVAEKKGFDENEFLDNLCRFALGGGVISHALGNNAASQGNLEGANAWHTIGSLQDANYQRQNMIDAAREGRSQVNVNIANSGNQNANFELLSRNLLNYLKPKTFLWKDGYNGGKVDGDVSYEECIETNIFYLDDFACFYLINTSSKQFPFPAKIILKNEKNEVINEYNTELPPEYCVGFGHILKTQELIEKGVYSSFIKTNYYVDYFINTPNGDIPLARRIVEFRKRGENQNNER